MARNLYIIGAFALALFLLMFATENRARAHEQDGVNYGDFKDSRGYSCCNDSDCRPTVAYQNDDGTWTALADGRKVLVPLDKILKMKSPDGRSHLCIAEDGIVPYCFVPADTRS